MGVAHVGRSDRRARRAAGPASDQPAWFARICGERSQKLDRGLPWSLKIGHDGRRRRRGTGWLKRQAHARMTIQMTLNVGNCPTSTSNLRRALPRGLWKGSVPANAQRAIFGPCPNRGWHYRCERRNVFVGSAACCRCCEHDDDGPTMRNFCRCTRPHPATAASRKGRVMAKFDMKRH